MEKKTVRVLFLSILVLAFSCQKKSGLDDRVKSGNRIFDNVGLLNEKQKENLLSVILDLEKNVGSQMAIIIIDTLNGESIEGFSIRMSEELKLGRPEINDGLLVTLAYKERQVRIEVGYGLERIIKDEIAAQVIRENFAPAFKEQKIYEGFHSLVKRLREIIEEDKNLIGQKY